MLRLPFISVVLLILSARFAPAATVTIDASVTNQFIDGFGVNANYWHFNSDELWAPLDALIDQGGMTIFRVVINNGWEAANDNADPAVMDWSYYNSIYSSPEFEKAWRVIEHLNQKGITNGVMLNFQGKGPNWLGGYELDVGMEEEWAEMVASLLIYARNTRHLHFTLVGPNNESDISSEGITINSSAQYVLCLHELAVLLDANGLSDIRFVAPDLSGTDISLIGDIMDDPLVMSKLAHFGFHSYGSGGSNSSGVLDFIQNSAYPDRNFWMTEFNVWCSECESGISGNDDWDYWLETIEYLFGHLANGASAALVWEGYDSYYPHHLNWSFWGLLAVENRNAFPKTYTPRKGFYNMAQITKFVRPGARRIDVNGSSPLELLAFYHDGLGQFTLVGINTDNTPQNLSAELDSLPDIASLDFYYTTSNTNLAHGVSVPVGEGGFSVTVPPSSVFTLTGFDPAKLAVSLQITNPPDAASFPAPTNLLIQAAASTTTGTLNSVSFFSNGARIGESSVAPYSFVWSNAPAGSYSLCARATNSFGNVGLSSAIHIALVGPVAEIRVTPPDAVLAPQSTRLFTATAFDALGSPLAPQPIFNWSVNGGGAIDASGLLTAGTNIGGPFLATANTTNVIGLAGFSVTTNLAPSGQAYTWYGMNNPYQNATRSSAPGLTDGNFNVDVHLLPGTGEDTSNAYEAAGVVWSNAQTILRVVFRNGSLNQQFDGVFTADFRLQFSSNGVNWVDAGPEWQLTPPYAYNSPDVVGVDFAFAGGITMARGVRCLGKVHTSEASWPPNSWDAFAREVQVFAGVVETAPSLSAAANGSGGIVISWPMNALGFVLECSTNMPPVSWSAVTNVPEQTNSLKRVALNTSAQQKFFRLRKP